MKIGLIGGTGIYDPEIFKEEEKKQIETPYGTSEVSIGQFKKREVFFISRHGKGHAIPPHKVNYRANVHALKSLGVERIISINSVGGINENLHPKDVVIPNDFIDFTRRRDLTFFDNETVHIDVFDPYCPEVRDVLTKAADSTVEKVFTSGVYACTEGPRFETPAEIRMMRTLGCDIVGMVGVPEVVLAREQEICYASVCMVTNYACGIREESLTVSEVMEIVKENQENIKKIITKTIGTIKEERNCRCKNALEGARV